MGREIALGLARKKYAVVIHYFTSLKDAEYTQRLCLAAGAPDAPLVVCDLEDATARRELIGQVTQQFGDIDLLVNNASRFDYDQPATYTHERLHRHLQTNYLAPLELTMDLYAAAQQSRRTAHVVTLLDQKVQNLNTDYMSYTCAKLASESSIRYLAQCCAPTLRVNAISPGVTLVSGEMSAKDFDQAKTIAALGHSSTPEDIVNAILMLDNARAVTGQNLMVDGGQHLVPRARDVAFKE